MVHFEKIATLLATMLLGIHTIAPVDEGVILPLILALMLMSSIMILARMMKKIIRNREARSVLTNLSFIGIFTVAYVLIPGLDIMTVPIILIGALTVLNIARMSYEIRMAKRGDTIPIHTAKIHEIGRNCNEPE